MNNDFKQGFEKIASISTVMSKSMKALVPKATKKVTSNMKFMKPKVHKSLGGVFGPGSFK